MARPRRIVVCDRSAGRARATAAFLERDPGLRVAGVFGGVEAMLARLEGLTPDLIALDLETAGTDAAAVVEPLVREWHLPVVLLGGRPMRDDERIAAALAAGALEAIAEDRLRLDDPESVWAVALRSRVKRLANVQLRRGERDLAVATARPRPWRRPGAAYRAVGIGASVGGPPALIEVLGRLPRDFPLPVLVVQHMAPGFGEGLTAWMDRSVPPPVAVARDGQTLRPGIWMAPEGAHLSLEPTMRLHLDGETVHGGHRPSVDVLFESLAVAAGAAAVGIVLTGMGRDGSEGIGMIAEAGGLTIAQDAGTSAVFGMPRAAIEAGVDLVLPLEEIGSRLASLRARSLR
jgi:two-component system chemotaxis response regulator CheB